MRRKDEFNGKLSHADIQEGNNREIIILVDLNITGKI